MSLYSVVPGSKGPQSKVLLFQTANSVRQHIRSHSFRRRDEIEQSETCGCFYCFSTFEPVAIHQWLDDSSTAVCPHCGMDSVIGSVSGFPLDRDTLGHMYRELF